MTDPAARLDRRTLILRADASRASGTGHFMRSFALAQGWLDRGGSATWLVAEAPDSLLARVAAEGISVERIGVTGGSSADAAIMARRLEAMPAAVAMIDGLAFGEAYLASLGGSAARLLLVDDLAASSTYPVGYLLNQNAHADRADYPADARCRFLLGLPYVLLRRDLRGARVRLDALPIARHLLVTFGGADPTGMTIRSIEALRGLPAGVRDGLAVRVLVGAANREERGVREAVAAIPSEIEFAVLRDVSEMAAQLAWADLALTSGGSTVWELARFGCPALVIGTTPAESRLMAGLARVGLFGCLGSESDLELQVLTEEIVGKVQDRAWRSEMSSLGMRLVDGDGVDRVLTALTQSEPKHEVPI